MNEKPHEELVPNDLRLNRYRRRLEVLCGNTKDKPTRLLDLIIDDGFIDAVPEFNVADFIQIIKSRFNIIQDSDYAEFNLIDAEIIQDALKSIQDAGIEKLIVLRYPHFNSPIGQRENALLDVYSYLQTAYFHAKNRFPKGGVVQVFDRSLQRALEETGATDTLLKVSATPQVVFSQE